ncbi:hypothetical protein B9G55_12985 [Saccharibacillus sp. O16]|nr:hypothetical protein B9G55_12985 [Saccharibacillus sp. O16]
MLKGILTHDRLEQSDVYELQKGDWEKEQTHWKSDSLYLTDDFFDNTETGAILREGLQNFNAFGPNRVLPEEWAAMINRAMQSQDSRTK